MPPLATVDPNTLMVLVALAVLAFGLCLATIQGIRRWWPARLGSDAPDGLRKHQAEPILRVGGLALAVAFVAGFLALHALAALEWPGFTGGPGQSALLDWPFFALGAVLFLVGFADDLFGVPASARLVVQILVGMCAHLCGMSIELISHPFADIALDVGSFSLLLTIGWFVALPNLINLVDGMDGLAGGVGLFLSLTLATIGGLSGNLPLLSVSLILCGGIAAFLRFNFPPAKIYMGDGGAYLIGYFIAAASLVTSNKGAVSSALLVVLIALGFPILDTSLAMLRRWATGVPLMAPDALHLHHRLQTLGISKRTLVLVLYGVFAALALLGLSVFVSAGYALPIVGMVLVVSFFRALRLLGLPHSLAEAKRSVREMLAARRDVRYAYVMAQVLSHDLDRVSDGSVFWRQVLDFLAKLGIHPVPTDLGHSSPPPKPVSPGVTCLVVYRLGEELLWKLCCPVPSSSRREWARVLRCLHPAILAGIGKYGPPPPELGVWHSSAKDPIELERMLNGERHADPGLDSLCQRLADWSNLSPPPAEPAPRPEEPLCP